MGLHQVLHGCLWLLLTLYSPQPLAISKCMVAGQPVYKEGVCVEGSESKMTPGAISEIGSTALRAEMQLRKKRADKQAKQMLAEQRRQYQLDKSLNQVLIMQEKRLLSQQRREQQRSKRRSRLASSRHRHRPVSGVATQ